MARLVWSPHALRDVQRAYRFLASKNIQAATRAVKPIRAGVKVLALQPCMGRSSQEMEPEYREWVIDFGASGYVALYRHDGESDQVTVLAGRHLREAGYEPGSGASGS
ncbi:MAG: type II toxin-antitoxin system RelE/ParE family toxin [Variovorax sp.]